VPPEAQATLPVALPDWLKKLDGAGPGLVVLDTGRDSNNAVYTAAKAADLVLVPCRAGGFDFLALGRSKAAQEIAALYAWLAKQVSAPATKKAKGVKV